MAIHLIGVNIKALCGARCTSQNSTYSRAKATCKRCLKAGERP